MSAVPSLSGLRPSRDVRVNVRPTSRVFLQNASVLASGGAFVAVLLLFSHQVQAGPHLYAGVAVGVLACGLSFALPWHRLPDAATMAVPLLTLLALAVLASGGIPVALLSVFPVLTLARAHGAFGGLCGVVGGIVVAWAPVLTRPTTLTSAHLPSLLLLPIVLVTVAVTVTGMERSSRARSRLLDRQDGALQQLLGELVQEREMLEGILAVLPAGVLVLDDGRVVLANAQVERLLGEHDSVGSATRAATWRPPARDEDDDGSAARLGALVARAAAGEPIDGETQWWRDADGERTAVRGTTVTLAGAPGRGVLRVVLLEDLTPQERAIQQREDFVRAVSHQLRTPLTSVVGYLDLVREDERLEADARGALDVADRNAQRVLRLVDDMMVASSLRTGPLALELALTDLGGVVRECLEAARSGAHAAGVRLVDDVRGRWVVRGERERLVHAVDHILANAVLYSDAGGEVRVELRSSAGGTELVVTDEGIGMSEEDREQVFDRFFRAPAVQSSSRHGTGLGLHVVHQIVAGHGGEVHVSSAPGEGTRVQVLLPPVLPRRSTEPAGAR